MKSFSLPKKLPLFLASIIILASCAKLEPKLPKNNETLDGPIEDLTPAQNAQFIAGDIAFTEVFSSAKGLGPLFVANSCASCHAGDGKGTPFTTLTRFGQSDSNGNQYLHLGGPQLQHRALPSFLPEIIPAGATFSKFTPPANSGLGFLEFVSDQDIISMSDEFDTNGDGISGKPNWIFPPSYVTPPSNAISQGGKYIHRFGKKAAAYNLLHQTVNAYNQDMGITSTFNPFDTYSGLATDPEVNDKTVQALVAYLQTLKAPIQRNGDDKKVVQGKNIFIQIQCGACHVPQLKTGNAPISALANKVFYPYTDLLLHDMGYALDDKYTEGNAKTYEWRTPPLWGLGLSPASQGGQYFLMHDGRAHSIEEAILLHGGEASQSNSQYQSLSQNEKNDLIQFLKSL
ncbi:MAG: thiol oxidoreductase [Bacteroidetes bacterium]|nr:thiol oxidoreductase [Bacteroidota bacterium]